MGLLDGLLGKSSAKAAQQAAADQMHYLNAGYDQAEKRTGAAYDAAGARLSPYEQSGRQGFDAYLDAIGINGADGYGRAKASFDADPFRAGMQDAASREITNLFRRYNPTGQAGTTQLAVGRATSDRYAQDVEAFRNRLASVGNTGLNVAGTMAGFDVDRGNRLADMAIGRNAGMANIRGQEVANVNAARQQGMNNLLGGLGALGNFALAGFAPGAGGASAFGNMARMFGGGSNSLASWQNGTRVIR